MRIRRAITALSTLVVAVVVALAVPASQLHTVAIVHECCCPDPDDCHCPAQPPCSDDAMRACHGQNRIVIAPVTPGLVVPSIPRVTVATRMLSTPPFVLPTLHQAPDPHRPSAPS